MDEKLENQLPRLYGPLGENHGRAKAQLMASLPAEAPRRSTSPWRRAARLLAGDDTMTIQRRILRLTPAAAAVAAVVVCAWILIGPGGVESVYAQLNQVVANTRAAEWVHFKSQVKGQPAEGWISVDPIRQAVKSADRIDYLDGPGLRHYIYDPADRTLRIELLDEEGKAVLAKLKQKTFLAVMLANIEQQIRKGGGRLTRRTKTSEGKTYTVFTFESARRKEAMSLWVDPATNRVAILTGTGGAWPEPIRLELDYPKTGPADIYALGVPRDAKVIVNAPGQEGAASQPATKPAPCKAAPSS